MCESQRQAITRRILRGTAAHLRWSAEGVEALRAGRYSKVKESRAAGRRAQAVRSRRSRWSPAALVLCTALLSGCGAAVWEKARGEADETAGEVSALRAAPEGPRFSAIRVIERPWLGLTRRERVEETPLPARLLAADGVTLPLAGIAEDSVLARRIEAAAGIRVRFTGEDAESGDASAAGTRAGIGVDRLSPDGGRLDRPPRCAARRVDGAEGLRLALRRRRRRHRDRAPRVRRVPHQRARRLATLRGVRLDRRRGVGAATRAAAC